MIKKQLQIRERGLLISRQLQFILEYRTANALEVGTKHWLDWAGSCKAFFTVRGLDKV
jgi:hypothetical protein